MEYLFFNAPLIHSPVRHSMETTSNVYLRNIDERYTARNIVRSLINVNISQKLLFPKSLTDA